jgi:pimeloyl-ACP methyl ester carboxylesterase
MLLVISIVLSCSLILLFLLQLWSYPGKPGPFVDENGKTLPGSIAEKIFVRINGVDQGMFIKGKDTANPVLLYLHGGMPDYFLTQNYPIQIEHFFTVCWWEQRGSGLSFDADRSSDTVTAAQLINDVLEVTKYLQHRFGKQKIYLMGHSGGSFLGIQAVARAPGRYHAYIGMAQMSRQLKSEQLAYDYMLDQFKKNGNHSMVRKLESSPVSVERGVLESYASVRDDAMHTLGIGTMHDMNSVLTGIFLPSLQFRQYTMGEKINLWRGKFKSGVSSVWKEMLATDLLTKVSSVDIPVYFLHGIHDYTVSYTEAKSYFDQLRAPVKGFYTFHSSAHSPLFEEPEKTMEIMRQDVLAGTNNLADKKENID